MTTNQRKLMTEMMSEEDNLTYSLINNDLKHIKLVNGLGNLSIDASSYVQDLSDTVLKRIGFDTQSADYDEIYDFYLELCDQSASIDISISDELLNNLAMNIYVELFQLQLGKRKIREKEEELASLTETNDIE